MTSKTLIFPLLAVALLTSCSATDEPALPDMPVIEAWIDSNGHPTVLFASAIAPDSDGGELADIMIRWGKVTISDGTSEVVLTGKRDSSYFPPYKYFTTEITGTPGCTYTLTADFKDMHAEARCTMPYPTSIQSITCEPIEGEDSLRSTMLRFIAPVDVPAYYYITVDGLPALMGWVEVTQPGVEITHPVYNTKSNNLSTEPFVAQFKRGERHIVSLHRVAEPVYRFWRAYDDMLMFGGNVLFGGGESLPGNIDGGLGIFSARATSSRFLIVD